MENIKKPEPTTIRYLDYFRVESYLKTKYNKDFTNFWNWICDTENIRNDGYFWLHKDDADPENMEGKEDIAEIVKLIFDEFEMFGDKFGDLYFKTSW